MKTRNTGRGGHLRHAAALCVTALAGACQQLGRLDTAERLLNLALAFARDSDTRRLAILDRLGVVLKTNGRYASAQRCYEEVQSALQSAPEPPAESLAAVHHNLSGLAYARGEYETAEHEIRTALATDRRRAVDRAADQGLLGAVLAAQGRRSEARAVLCDALRVMEHICGTTHYEVAVLLQNLAALDQRHDPVRSQQLYERALHIKRRRLGSTHPEVGVLLNNIATLHRQQHRRQLALACCTEALEILQRRYGRQHPATQACEHNLRRIS